MKIIKGQYINLMDRSLPEADPAEVKFDLDAQEVHLSGCKWSRIWNGELKLFHWTREIRQTFSRIDLSGLVKVLLDGISYLLAAFGVLKRFAGGGSDANGA